MNMNKHVENIRAARPDPFPPIALTEDEVRRRCAGAPIWHSIDLGEGWVEGRRKTSAILDNELKVAQLPDMTGKTVLDVGAFGGFFSFEAARRGANVTAIDFYSWVTDFPALGRWVQEEKAKGNNPNDYDPPAHVLDLKGTPGKKPFDVVNAALGNPVKTHITTLENFKPKKPFDITLYLGVLYHTRDPFGALQKVADVTKETAVIETLAMHEPERPDTAYWNFHGGDRSVNDDPTTYWSPSAKGLEHMLKRVGFKTVEIKNQPFTPDKAHLYRLWVHASK